MADVGIHSFYGGNGRISRMGWLGLRGGMVELLLIC
jgi:hypothetical protein